MMVLLTLVAIAMLSLSTIEQRSSGGGANEADRMARANARMALMMALGELQKAAGPDQRVTATAGILGNANNTGYSMNGATQENIKDTTAVDGRKHWVGVWDSTNYNPADPDNKPFLRWLVSGSEDNTGDNLNSLTAVGTAAATDDLAIFEGLDAAGTVKVPKVEVASTAGNKSYYAYWVEDEGVKVDLKWEEIQAASNSSDDEERAQARRLSSLTGPNYWLAAGPFRDPNDDASTSDALIDVVGKPNANFSHEDMDKVGGMADVALMADGQAAHSDWLISNRHRYSTNNRSVLADVKKGGLRRDLTLAFEMDGDADITATQQPTLFNQQVGEFVGGTDKNGSLYDYPAASGLPRARYLFRENRDTGGPFSDKVYLKTSYVGTKRTQSTPRGPTWWNLRDYYNLYKRMEKSGSNYRMKARAYYPDRSTIGYDHGQVLDTITTWADHRDTEYRNPHQGMFAGQWKYVFRPARPNYAPVFLGTTVIISVTGDNYDPATQTAEITITLDPIFYFWNPYNREVEVDNLMVHFDVGFSGTVNIWVTDTASGTTTTYSPDLWELLSCNFFNYHGRGGYPNYGFLINESSGAGTSPFVLAPGEVVAASPSSNTGQSYLGYDPLNNASGIFLSSVNVQDYNSYWKDPAPYRNRTVRASVVAGATSINVGYHNPTGSGGQSVRHYMDSSLAPAGTTPSIFQSTSSVPGNQLQHTHMQLTSLRHEYRNPQTIVWPVPKDFNTLVNFDGDTGAFLGGVKQQFGLFTYLMKPANWSGLGANAAEIFSRFNPAPMVINKDWWAAVTPNMLFNFIADGTPNNLVSNYGLNFSTSARNAFWGKSYDSSGQTSVPMSNIPSSPLLSIVDFGHANLGTMAEDPFHSVGNSLPSPVISPIAPYGTVYTGGGEQTYGTGTDLSWHLNDSLFDRYFLSGIVPEYTIGAGGYAPAVANTRDAIEDTLQRFYGMDPSDTAQSVDPNTAQASPVMEAHVPADKTREEIVSELLQTTLNDGANATPGYKKMAAYSLLKGGFNVNCTDANAWGALLRGVDPEVKFTDGTTDNRSSTVYFGFPRSSSPSPSATAFGYQTWSSWSRLRGGGSRGDLWGPGGVSTNIPIQVMERAPFMSVSNFVNRKVGGSTITNHHKKGAVESSLGNMWVKDVLFRASGNSSGGVSTDYSKHGPLVPSTTENTNTARGIPGDVTQADVIRNIAPRLTARSDTFRIRGYGEVRDDNGTPGDLTDDTIIASAVCEALVQRLPEYVDPNTDPDNNEPWDEGATLNIMNQTYGRRFEIRSFRWLDDSEV
ncbi:hypothetical protein N9496_05960 [Akkermansiaceae bacterium]|nr:hypothetical protein [Akkermansiaceae bacterium]